MLGNVYEWCADTYLKSLAAPEYGTGLRFSGPGGKTLRGGSYLGFDRFGLDIIQPDDVRISSLAKVVEAGATNDWLINNTDFAPTILALAGVRIPKYMQGRSFATALRGEPRPDDWRTATYYRYWMHMAHNLRVPAHFGIRTERYKLIFFYGCTPSGGNKTPVAWELYDLMKDPSEMRNQYGNPEYDEVVTNLKQQLWQTRESLNETDRNFPQIQAIIDANVK